MSRGAAGVWVELLLQTSVLELSTPQVFPAVGDLRDPAVAARPVG